ncbi:MAG: peptide deformylase [Clostridiales bacterium]|nr:peptide deformylase [Clostridiales bacterium]
MEREILLLGNPKLYERSDAVKEEDLAALAPDIQDLHDTLIAFRNKYQAGRAIAAPQIGIQKRLLYMYIDEPTVFINPVLTFIGEETMEVMDDCMSFPTLLVKVRRYRKCKIQYRDPEWNACEIVLEGDLSELLQHEYDHLDGILATMRAIDDHSFYMKKEAICD